MLGSEQAIEDSFDKPVETDPAGAELTPPIPALPIPEEDEQLAPPLELPIPEGDIGFSPEPAAPDPTVTDQIGPGLTIIDPSPLVSDIVSGVASGTFAGLIISGTLWFINHFSKPKFEYFDIGNGLGHFFYNRYLPIVVGGSFVLGHGPAMTDQTRRAGTGGFYMGPKHDEVFSTSSSAEPHFGLSPGESIEISYRYAPIRYWWNLKRRQQAFRLEVDPTIVFNARHTPSDQDLRKTAKGWKIGRAVLKPSATRSI